MSVFGNCSCSKASPAFALAGATKVGGAPGGVTAGRVVAGAGLGVGTPGLGLAGVTVGVAGFCANAVTAASRVEIRTFGRRNTGRGVTVVDSTVNPRRG